MGNVLIQGHPIFAKVKSFKGKFLFMLEKRIH